MRAQIRQLVAQLQPFDELEKQHQQVALAWLDSDVEIFRLAKPATPPQHLVAFFVVIDPTAHKILLGMHLKAGAWLASGGHVEPGEHPRTTVGRECQEELQRVADFWQAEPLLLTMREIVDYQQEHTRHTDVSFWYVLQSDAQAPRWFDPAEYSTMRWFDYTEALTLTNADPNIARFIAKLQATLVLKE